MVEVVKVGVSTVDILVSVNGGTVYIAIIALLLDRSADRKKC